ncbi:hypothetical protein PAEPH01_0328 [Pancytospora epiphaga]|nr:hypothetical protein PAEPH01_0328 [Pancytospora epiphaga]
MIRRVKKDNLQITQGMRYRNLVEIGRGTFGKVYRGMYCGNEYALKEYTYPGALVHATTIREILALRSVRHRNVIELLEIVIDKYKILAVFPLCVTDLGALIRKTPLGISECRRLFNELLLGIQHVHSHGFIHRDLKTSNILLQNTDKNTEEFSVKQFRGDDPAGTSNLVVKICDMGMARPSAREMTPGVVTLWYRAPELLLGSTKYGSSVDVWSIGCILSEMLTGSPLFAGDSDISQLEFISKLCGRIDEDSMPEFKEYPLSQKVNFSSGVRTILVDLQHLNSDAVDLIDKILVLDPQKRLTIEQCLAHPFLAR